MSSFVYRALGRRSSINCVISIAFLFMSGCGGGREYVEANLAFSRVGGLGFSNTSLFEPGTLFVWRAADGSIFQAGSLELINIEDDVRKSSLTSRSISSIGMTARIDGAIGGDVLANIGSQISVHAVNAYRDRHAGVIDSISKFFSDAERSGRDMEKEWRTRETQLGEVYYLVVITDVIRADDVKISVSPGGGAFRGQSLFGFPSGRSINLDFKNSIESSCIGSEAPCFFNVSVVETYYQKNGNLGFTPVFASRRLLDGLATSFREAFAR